MADDLTTQGIATLKSGNKKLARQLLTAAIASKPDDETAWLWLSGAVESDAERVQCLMRVLEINPANRAAQLGFSSLESKMSPTSPSLRAPAKEATITDPITPPSGVSPISTTNVMPLPDTSSPPLKKCPYCAEEIQDEAVLCRFCGRDLTQRPTAAKTGTRSGSNRKRMILWIALVILAVLLLAPVWPSEAVVHDQILAYTLRTGQEQIDPISSRWISDGSSITTTRDIYGAIRSFNVIAILVGIAVIVVDWLASRTRPSGLPSIAFVVLGLAFLVIPATNLFIGGFEFLAMPAPLAQIAAAALLFYAGQLRQ